MQTFDNEMKSARTVNLFYPCRSHAQAHKLHSSRLNQLTKYFEFAEIIKIIRTVNVAAYQKTPNPHWKI